MLGLQADTEEHSNDGKDLDMSPELERALEEIPPHMKESIVRYLEHGTLPGQFLVQVLSDNLTLAGLAADAENVKLWRAYATIVYYMPALSVGSREKVSEWIRNKQNQK